MPATDVLRIAVAPPASTQLGQPLVPAPEIQLVDPSGQPRAMSGVSVAVALSGGAGTLLGTTTRATDPTGRAAFPGLSITGAAVGMRSLLFSSPGLTGVISGAIQVDPGPPGSLEAVSAVDQAAVAGGTVDEPPAVRVRDALGNLLAGARVDFAVTAGGGLIAGSPATTGADGVARAGDWTLGPAGPQAVQATTPSLTGTVTFTATARDPAAAYDITLRFLSGVTDAQRLAFRQARERIERIVVGDLPSVVLNVPGGRGCGPPLAETVDDVLILVDIGPIDGVGNVLGQAGPCYIRSGSGLPVVGQMQFDSADLANLEARGLLGAVILHEMLHVVGFGVLWSNLGLLTDEGLADPIFTGPLALDAFLSANGGSGYPGRPVPVEDTGGTGTRDSHWRETVFKSELMTGFLSGSAQALSLTTVESLGDLGYAVDPASADPFNIATALRLGPEAGATALGDDVLRIPLQEIDARGNALPATP